MQLGQVVQVRGTAQEFCPHDPAQKRHDEFECFKIQPLYQNGATVHESALTAQEFCSHDPAQKRHAESGGFSNSNRFISMALVYMRVRLAR